MEGCRNNGGCKRKLVSFLSNLQGRKIGVIIRFSLCSNAKLLKYCYSGLQYTHHNILSSGRIGGLDAVFKSTINNIV